MKRKPGERLKQSRRLRSPGWSGQKGRESWRFRGNFTTTCCAGQHDSPRGLTASETLGPVSAGGMLWAGASPSEATEQIPWESGTVERVSPRILCPLEGQRAPEKTGREGDAVNGARGSKGSSQVRGAPGDNGCIFEVRSSACAGGSSLETR